MFGENTEPHPATFTEMNEGLVLKVCLETSPSGMDVKMCRQMLTSRRHPRESQDLGETLTTLGQKLCTDNCEHVDALTTSRLISLPKVLEAVRVRPFGTGEVLRRLIGKSVMKVAKNYVMKTVETSKCALGNRVEQRP